MGRDGVHGIASVVLGWFDLFWPYLAVVVIVLVAIQAWWFRESLAQVRFTRGWIATAFFAALVWIGTVILWWIDAPGYAWVIFLPVAWVSWLLFKRFGSR
jgi:hypothetical protein